MGVNISINSKSLIYVGIGGSMHDYSACLLKDGKIINAIESERVNRVKHSLNTYSPINTALKYLIPQTKINVKSISSSDILDTHDWRGVNTKDVTFYNHHLCHAASSFYTSPFKEAAIFVCDGLGSVEKVKNGYIFETYSYYTAKNTLIDLIGRNTGFVDDNLDEILPINMDVPNSLGSFYNLITGLIGFEWLEDGKTMGLSAYGNSDKYYSVIREYFDLKPYGKIDINFGLKTIVAFKQKYNTQITSQSLINFRADVAAAAQRVLEDCYVHSLNYIYSVTKSDNLCLSGGVTLNSMANGKILNNTPFKYIHFFPACGDAGIAVGAAYLSYYKNNKKRVFIDKQTPFLGKEYSEKRIISALNAKNIHYVKAKDVYSKAAKLLVDNKIVGWFQGGSEIGPRALGHRSIVVDPRKKWMKDYLNMRVKRRESFRPFAPAILEEHVNDYFEGGHRSPYMLEVFPIKKSKQQIIPAVVHVDGTGRIQTVGPDNNEFYKLIQSFYKLTGVPIILNTSFNVNRMPIVETPEDAIDCFMQTNIDALVIGNFVCIKKRSNDNILLFGILNWFKPYYLNTIRKMKIVNWKRLKERTLFKNT